MSPIVYVVIYLIVVALIFFAAGVLGKKAIIDDVVKIAIVLWPFVIPALFVAVVFLGIEWLALNAGEGLRKIFKGYKKPAPSKKKERKT